METSEMSPEGRAALGACLNISDPAELESIIEDASDYLRLLKKKEPPSKPLYSTGEQELVKAGNRMLLDTSYDLTGPSSALVACWILKADVDLPIVTSRQISKKLGDERALSNPTSTMGSLEEKEFVTAERDENGDTRSHKRFQMTPEGEVEAERIIRAYRDKIIS